MEQILNYFITTDNVIQKGVFIMVSGIVFVFAVQLVFYLTVKLWPKKRNK